DNALRQAVTAMQGRWQQELATPQLHPARAKALTSLGEHWEGLTLFVEHPTVPMGRVERWRGGLGEPCVLPTLSVAGARVAPHTPSPPPAPRTGRADFPHPALIRTLKPSHSAWPSDGREPRTAPVPRRGNGPDTACSPYRPAGA